MRGPCAEEAELARSVHDASSEMVQPDPVRKDSTDERVRSVRDVLRPREPSSRRGQRRRLFLDLESLSVTRGDRQVGRFHSGERLPVIASVEDVSRVRRPSRFLEHADEVFDLFLSPLRRDDRFVLL